MANIEAARPVERERSLRGIAAAPGYIVGRARVFADPLDAGKLAPGDIVVAFTASPRWLPLFGTLGAFVAESGGSLSNAALAARECGIPAVLGVAGATRVIRDGARIEVDGTAGTVRVLS